MLGYKSFPGNANDDYDDTRGDGATGDNDFDDGEDDGKRLTRIEMFQRLPLPYHLAVI